MEEYIGAKRWKWMQLTKSGAENVQVPIKVYNWQEQVRKNKTNLLQVKSLDKVVKGSLIYKQNWKKERDYKIFHFYLTKDMLVTVDLDWAELTQTNPDELQRQLERTETAAEGFLLLLGELVNDLLAKIDQFEEELRTLIWCVKKRNETGILELVYQRRHELLVRKSLLIPIKEINMGIEEIDLHASGEVFVNTSRRIERACTLLIEYENQLDSMINLEEVISSHRGNEIMKTLTVITTIFTPIMAFGALWGMNFKNMPELEWHFGYVFSIFLIIISTLLLYGYLKIKGWTGDLLKGKKKGAFFE
ncbi:magnesium transporter CorA family protein [Neobacillus mesonae]|uniref:magnesium transporter CorA family protein n=1 Tax=Neobacillus mesonae TaxID=1193713 RepID=UPI00203CB471|nr:magnesium transporter CorA family protein [Neobacillus mesonae]MCM3570517.1 magnesium transporter CorA family protein [Neobacillus mesonae]